MPNYERTGRCAMRLVTLLVGPLLISAAIYAQHSPVSSSTPVPPTHSSPPPSPPSPPPSSSSSSSSGGMHTSSSSGSSFPSSSAGSGASASSSNHGGSSAGSSHSGPSGIDHSGLGSSSRNEHEHDREASRDSHNGGGHDRDPSTGDSNSGKHHGREPSSTGDGARDERKDSSAGGSHDRDRNWNRGDHEPVVAGTHDRDAKVIDPSLAPGGRGPEGRPEPSGIYRVPCEKEPCAKAEPQLSHADWRVGRCKEGPCEPCPEGTTPTRYGYCAANPKPVTASPGTACAGGTVWNGVRCMSTADGAADLAAAQAAAARCIFYYSEGVRVSTDLSLAKARETRVCLEDPDSAACRFAHMDVVAAQASCSILETQAPIQCQSSIPSCL